MKFLWVQDLSPLTSNGGAEFNDRTMIIHGIRKGYDVDLCTPQNADTNVSKYDAVILSNSTSFKTSFYDEIIKSNKPYVLFIHDYGPQLCKWRLFYPMEERCRTICFLRDRWWPYLDKASLIIWLSPAHRDAWLWGEPRLENKHYALIPSAIDPSMFYDMKKPRNGALAVNADAAFKGWSNIKWWAEQHPGMQVSLMGTVHKDAPPNIQAISHVSYDKMNEVYNDYTHLLHLPNTVGPFDRVTAEAYLAGCKVIGNKLVGALSWPWFHQGREEVAKQLRLAPANFWSAIEESIHGRTDTGAKGIPGA